MSTKNIELGRPFLKTTFCFLWPCLKEIPQFFLCHGGHFIISTFFSSPNLDIMHIGKI